MAIADILSGIGTVAGAVGKRTADVVSGEAPQIDAEQRKRSFELEDQQIAAKAKILDDQLATGVRYGTLTNDQQKQYAQAISDLYSHPRHAGTLMEKLRQAIHPNGAFAQGPQPPLPNATPQGGTLAADTASAEQRAASKQKPPPKDALFLEAFAKQRGKAWSELTPDELIEAFNQEGETKAAQEKEAHQKALEDYRDSTLKLRQSEEKLHEAQFKASQDPSNPKYKLEVEKARTQSLRDEAYMINAQARAFGEVNGRPLPGAMLTSEGQPVGAAFQGNVKPTATEIQRSDLATSTLEQLGDVRGLIQKRPDLFGPAAGRETDFSVWLGSQDPDAQRFRAAISTISSHLSGVYGARGKYAQEDIARTIGQFRTNPEALAAALDQYEKAAKTIQGRGIRNVVGGLPTGATQLKTPPGGVGRVIKPAGGTPPPVNQPKVIVVTPADMAQ